MSQNQNQSSISSSASQAAPVAAPAQSPPGVGFVEFVCLVAAMMALNALAIDSMLPALPAIGTALDIASENSRQWVITAYLLGFGVAQLFYGPLSDRYGRKPLLIVGISIYALFSLIAASASSFEMMMLARVGQGVGAAATRVLAVSIVRDTCSGRAMARVMSLSVMVFLGVPIIAPSVGQAIMLVAPWRWIFVVLAVLGVAMLVWILTRLPETLKGEDRRPIQPGAIASAFGQALTNRMAIGYTLAVTATTGALFGFINSSQQIFANVFRAADLFPLIFAAVAAGIAVASLLNARFVGRFGSRLISHSAMIGFIGFSALHLLVAALGYENIIVFAVLQACTMFCFGFMGGNFSAMAMEPMGHIAGAASSAQGFISTVGGALAGFFIGQHFNGTTVPMSIGFTVCGLLAMLFVLFAERGRLFKAHHAPLPKA